MRKCIKYQFQGVKGILSESPCVPGSIPGGTNHVKCNPFVNNYLQMDFYLRKDLGEEFIRITLFHIFKLHKFRLNLTCLFIFSKPESVF